VGGEGSVDVIVSIVGVRPGFSSLEARGVWEGGSAKLNDGTFEGGKNGRRFHPCCSERRCGQRSLLLRAWNRRPWGKRVREGC